MATYVNLHGNEIEWDEAAEGKLSSNWTLSDGASPKVASAPVALEGVIEYSSYNDLQKNADRSKGSLASTPKGVYEFNGSAWKKK